MSWHVHIGHSWLRGASRIATRRLAQHRTEIPVKKLNAQRRFSLVIAAGIMGAFLVADWWHGEMASFVGDPAAQNSFHCLTIAGTEDCAALSLVGLHVENQIASFLYYGFASLVIWGLMKADGAKMATRNRNQGNRKDR
jgi:hypothetical protein